MTTLAAITDDTFDTTLTESQTPVLVDFWAPWCRPCQQLTPILGELADDYGDQLSIVKLNVEDNRRVASQFNVAMIPTLILFKDGKAIAEIRGSKTKSQLAEFLDGHLAVL